MSIQLPERIELAHLPTPVREAPALTDRIGRKVHVKRDDLTGCAASGNKARKLEFLLAEARAEGADTVITPGDLQSNHCRATAALARQAGLRPLLVLRGEMPGVPEGNFFLDRLFGAETAFVSAADYAGKRAEVMAMLAQDLGEKGRKPYLIPEGGSNALGCLGYVQCAFEIARFSAARNVPFDRIYHPAGSGGTTAGLCLGAEIFGLEAEIVGINVGEDRESLTRRVRNIMSDAGDRFRLPLKRPLDEIPVTIVDGYAGEGYGSVDDELSAFIVETARTSGLVLDPVYTGKGLLGLIGEERKRTGAANVLFLHTGGIFGLFARTAEILGEPGRLRTG